MHETRSRFRELLTGVESINDREWKPDAIHEELEGALRVLEDARIEYAGVQSRLQSLNPAAEHAPEPDARAAAGITDLAFGPLLKIGAVVAIPVAVVLAAALVALALILGRG